MAEKVVLAYSGGLDTSIIIPWLNENYGYDVIAFIADVGQGEDLDAVVAKAYKTGAKKAIVKDLREEFLNEYVFPAVRAGAVYEHKYMLGTSIARPVIAKHQVEVALAEGATALAHGSTGKGNDQVRFEHAFQALAPQLKVIVPWREWKLVSREDCLDYAAAHNVEVEASRTKIHSRDRNLWHVSHEGGELEGTDKPVDASTWRMSQSPQEAPDRVEQVEISFERGTPVSVNGQRMPAVQLVELLYETPGGTLILEAIRQIESLTLDRETAHFKETLALKYAELVYFGLWFTPLREALDAFFTKAEENVTGTVKMALYKGNISFVSRTSPVSLYNVDLSSFTMGESYDQKDAAGFIKILGLPARVRAQVMGRQKEKEKEVAK